MARQSKKTAAPVAEKQAVEVEKPIAEESQPITHKEVPFDPQSMREPAERERPLSEIIAESRKTLTVPPEPGQKYFEAPNGYVMAGEVGADRVWCRHAEGADKKQGAWINPYRGKVLA